jgi:hypothetical protein
LFPDDFKDAIPEKALALVMACVSDSFSLFFMMCLILSFKIYNCLDEYMIDGTQNLVKFEGSEYSTIYDSMLDLIESIKGDPYHGNKWEENRRRWARKGWSVF